MHGLCNGTGCIVGIDVVSRIIIIHTNGTHNGLGIYIRNISHKSDILPLGELLLYPQKSSVLSAESHSPNPQGFHQAYQFLIYFSQHHFCQFHGFLVRYPQPVDKSGLFSHFAYPLADFLSAAVDNNGFKSHQL